MEKKNISAKFDPQRLGVSYLAEESHFGIGELERALPMMEELGIRWITLRAPISRAIPEQFISKLLEKGIQPIIHIPFSLETPPITEDISAMIRAYANWGVQYISIFDRPNLRSSWPHIGWTQRGLVKRFLELFTPLAKLILELGMSPVFSPLEPGGDYWDTAFLRAALEELAAHDESELLDGMALGSYAFSNGHPLDWGAGGPERWPSSLPYFTPEESEDQQGFRIFDWYNAISKAVVGRELPILVLAAGESVSSSINKSTIVEMAKHVALPQGNAYGNFLKVPSNVLAVNFQPNAEDSDPNSFESGWLNNEGKAREHTVEWLAWKQGAPELIKPDSSLAAKAIQGEPHQDKADAHYLLLPTYEWGKSKWHLDVIQSFVKKYQPSVGYSLSQARKSSRVTIVGGSRLFTEDILQLLRDSGCEVEQILGDGALIASQLATL